MTQRPLPDLIDDVVLGLAEEAEAAQLEAMAASDPAIAAALEHTRQKFAPLDATADDLPLPDGFWADLEARIDSHTGDRVPPVHDTRQIAAPATGATVVDLNALHGRLRSWRNSALTGIAASLALAALLGWSLLSPSEPSVVAVLLNANGEAVALVEGMADNTTRVTLLDRPEVPPDQVMQVWTKPDDNGPPVSLGLLETGRSQTLSLDGLPAPHARQLYEITSEPAGGSPTQLPTGPILGKGLAQVPVI